MFGNTLVFMVVPIIIAIATVPDGEGPVRCHECSMRHQDWCDDPFQDDDVKPHFTCKGIACRKRVATTLESTLSIDIKNK